MVRLRLLMAAVMLGTLLLVPATAQAANAPTIPVTGSGPTQTFTGSLTIDRFVRQGSQILAVGTLDGILTNTVTGVQTTITDLAVRLPILGTTTATCDILHLELGPLDLDLLGLVIHLDRIVLDITAVPGPGNLLGNLLCAIAGLLDGGGPLARLTGLLNQLLMLLG
jgi:hypothetical protein